VNYSAWNLRVVAHVFPRIVEVFDRLAGSMEHEWARLVICLERVGGRFFNNFFRSGVITKIRGSRP